MENQKIISEIKNEVLHTLVPMRLHQNRYGRLFHYTSPDGLLGILRPGGNAVLWFTRADCLNDYSEGEEILQFICQYCDSQADSNEISPEFADEIKKLTTTDLGLLVDSNNKPYFEPCDTYLCCFSEDDDSLAMWNYYSKSNRYEGYCIGFDFHSEIVNYNDNFSNAQEKKYQIDIINVIYSDEEKRHLLDRLIPYLNQKYQETNDSEIRRACSQSVQSFIDMFRFQFKHKAFSHEKEVRAILRIPKGQSKDFDVKYRNSNGYIVPYIEYTCNPRVFRSLRIAPMLKDKMLKDKIAVPSLQKMLEDRGYGPHPVDHSTIPIRF